MDHTRCEDYALTNPADAANLAVSVVPGGQAMGGRQATGGSGHLITWKQCSLGFCDCTAAAAAAGVMCRRLLPKIV
jgi:hypothetical protein